MELIGKNKSTMLPFRFGIIGNIAAGKTHTAKQLGAIAKEEGVSFVHLEVDQIRREILVNSLQQNHLELRKKLTEELELPIKNSPYWIPGELLGEAIFSEPKKMAAYKKLINPEILKELRHLAKGHDIVAIEWAMLMEDGWVSFVQNNLLLVHCSEEKQTERLKETDLPLEQLKKRISFQPSLQERRKTVEGNQKKGKKVKLIEWETTSDPDFKAYKDLFLRIKNKLLNVPLNFPNTSN